MLDPVQFTITVNNSSLGQVWYTVRTYSRRACGSTASTMITKLMPLDIVLGLQSSACTEAFEATYGT